MTALPMQMEEAAILREMGAHERRMLAEAPKIDLRAFVRSAFESALVESVGLKTVRDAQAFVTHLLERNANRTLTMAEQTKVGIEVVTEWNTRNAARSIRGAQAECASCRASFALDENRYLVRLENRGPTTGPKGWVCESCLHLNDYRDVLTTTTMRHEIHRDGRPYGVLQAEGAL